MAENLFTMLDGKAYTLDGVHGVLRHETFEARYPYARTISSLIHRPSAAGKRSKAYAAMRSQLGDDWMTDLTTSERLGEIACALGIG